MKLDKGMQAGWECMYESDYNDKCAQIAIYEYLGGRDGASRALCRKIF